MSQDVNDSFVEVLFNGTPAVVKLSSGESVLAIVSYHSDIDEYTLSKPLQSLLEKEDDKVTVKFSRWVFESAAVEFPIYMENVVHMTPCTATLVDLYTKYAEILYAPLVEAYNRQQEQATDISAPPAQENAAQPTPTKASPTPMLHIMEPGHAFTFLPAASNATPEQVIAHHWGLLLSNTHASSQPN